MLGATILLTLIGLHAITISRGLEHELLNSLAKKQLVFAIAGVIRVWLPQRLLKRLLGGRGLGPVSRAAVIGAPMPLCSCSVIPTVASLRRSGAGKS